MLTIYSSKTPDGSLWRQVEEFIRTGRKELELTSGDIVRGLGYEHLASVWKLKKAIEGLPTKLVYAWVAVFQVPRDLHEHTRKWEALARSARRVRN